MKERLVIFLMFSNAVTLGVAIDRDIRNPESGRCVTINGAMGKGQDNNRFADIYDCINNPNQKWEFVSASGGGYEVIARHSRKCLTAGGGTMFQNQGVINQYTCIKGPNQIWTTESVPKSTSGEIYIKIRGTNKCLTVKNGLVDKGNGVKLEIYDCVNQKNQIFVTNPVLETFPPPDPCGGKDCDWRENDLVTCCNGAYCKSISASKQGVGNGVCVRVCWTEGSPCNLGDKLPCCEQMSCEDNGTGFKCFRKPKETKCVPEGKGCGIAPIAAQCCAGSSCKGANDRGAKCDKGDCYKRGQQCDPNNSNKPCCSFSQCRSYRGSVPLCTPFPPQCGRKGDKIPGCRLGDASYGFACCARRCEYLGMKTSGTYIDKDYACPCSSVDHFCVSDSDCCNNDCGPDYICAK